MTLTIPDQFAQTFDVPERDLMVDLAVGLYTGSHLTLGKAAEFAGQSKSHFLDELSRRHIPVAYDTDDLAADLETLSAIESELK
jgi:predicted HTH domain antitoxin